MKLLRLKFPEYFFFISILIAYWKQFHVALAGSMASLGHSWLCVPGWPWTTDPPSTAGINMRAPHTEPLFSFLFLFSFKTGKGIKRKIYIFNLHSPFRQTHSKMCQALQWELWQMTTFWNFIHLPNICVSQIKIFFSSFHPTAKQFHTFLKSSLFTVFTRLCICD